MNTIILILVIIGILYLLTNKGNKAPNLASDKNVSKPISSLNNKEKGAVVFEVIRNSLANDELVSYDALLRKIGKSKSEVTGRHVTEALIGISYAALMEFDSAYSQQVAKEMIDGLVEAFANHLMNTSPPMKDIEKSKVIAYIWARLKEYQDVMSSTTDVGQKMFRFASKYYLNITGETEPNLENIMAVTEFWIAHKGGIHSALEKIREKSLTK